MYTSERVDNGKNKLAGVNLRFAKVSEAEILQIQDEAVPDNTKKTTKCGMKVFKGYSCIRLDRSGIKEGFGGVAIYAKESLSFRVRNDLHSAANECLWIELTRTKCRPVLICCAYRAPVFDFANFISNLEISMTKVNLDKCDFVLLGDLNVNMLPYSRKKEKQELKKFAISHDLTQLITEATRVTETSKTLLDVILVNNDHRITDSGVPVSLSDHYLVYCVLKAGIIKAPPKTIEYRSYKSFDENIFLADLNSVPWHVIENEEDIDDAVFIWNQLFSEIADLHAPVKRRRIRGVPLPWLNDKINEVMKDRDFHHRKAVKTNSVYHWACNRKLRNRVNREVKAAESSVIRMDELNHNCRSGGLNLTMRDPNVTDEVLMRQISVATSVEKERDKKLRNKSRCQKEHWTEHKVLCQAISHLSEASSCKPGEFIDPAFVSYLTPSEHARVISLVGRRKNLVIPKNSTFAVSCRADTGPVTKQTPVLFEPNNLTQLPEGLEVNETLLNIKPGKTSKEQVAVFSGTGHDIVLKGRTLLGVLQAVKSVTTADVRLGEHRTPSNNHEPPGVTTSTFSEQQDKAGKNRLPDIDLSGLYHYQPIVAEIMLREDRHKSPKIAQSYGDLRLQSRPDIGCILDLEMEINLKDSQPMQKKYTSIPTPLYPERFMERCLRELRDKVAIPYLDDIIAFSGTFEDHVEYLRALLRRLRERGLKLRPHKCSLLKREVQFLGRVVSGDSYQMDRMGCVKAIEKLKETTPKTVGKLADYNFEIRYWPGKASADADTLSRMPVSFEEYMKGCSEAVHQDVLEAATSSIYATYTVDTAWLASPTAVSGMLTDERVDISAIPCDETGCGSPIRRPHNCSCSAFYGNWTMPHLSGKTEGISYRTTALTRMEETVHCRRCHSLQQVWI
ncbi:Retrovirus-related Pol polyprotein [Stylophora pistillata]|uniref:Retrovirus-related Pol polyprotein n=1 Tax=Stylophora pistillata TaxID=50429 RepID=A0A2B4S9Q3_STYPI|nr:Retrovirus-related Pol polyprotein [Stylophora pistillata]